jgi:A/G-specific adenine glycosylase
MATLRASHGPVGAPELAAVWPDDDQRERALAGLLSDGLAARQGDTYGLPG